MGAKKLIRDTIFVIIAINLMITLEPKFIFYGLIMLFFTVFFYIGKKF